jgi:3-isopropylmalate dehydrogenase
MTHNVLVLPGDGIGPEIIAEAVKVLEASKEKFGLDLTIDSALLGGAAIDATGGPLPEATMTKAKACDAILLGAVGGPKWDGLDMAIRPEKGLLGIRSGLELFGNLRPASLYPE